MTNTGEAKRPIVIAGNWKMHKTRQQAVELAHQLVKAIADKSNLPEIFLFPPFTSIEYVSVAVNGTHITVGAQNVNEHDHGSFTGEVSVEMVKDCGAGSILIGHSERRHVFGETDAQVHAKLEAVLKAGLMPVLCVGETIDQRRAGQTDSIIEQQIKAALSGLKIVSLIIAYEPVWAIGTGEVCEADEAQRVIKLIRSIVAECAGGSTMGDRTPILYGGSVKPGNISGLLAKEGIDGVLAGGASLTAEEFVPLIEAGCKRLAPAK